MSVSEIKEKLHHAIDAIDNPGVLEAVFTILTQKEGTAVSYSLDEGQLRILREREEKFIKGESNTVTLEKFRSQTNAKYGL